MGRKWPLRRAPATWYKLEKPSTFDILCSYISWTMDFPGGSVVKNPSAMQEMQETRVQSLSQEGGGNGNPWRRKWQPTPVSLPGESHGQRSLAGYNPRGLHMSSPHGLSHLLQHLLRVKFVFKIFFYDNIESQVNWLAQSHQLTCEKVNKSDKESDTTERLRKHTYYGI